MMLLFIAFISTSLKEAFSNNVLGRCFCQLELDRMRGTEITPILTEANIG